MIEFELNGHEFIPLNKLLKLLNLVQSGGEANQ
jgi:ribosome-associated protein YbcJ (S4-like RNA binding protein)